MGKIFLKAAMVFVAIGLSIPALADVRSELSNICKIIEKDDKAALQRKVKKIQKNYKRRLPDYYSDFTCGGQSLIRHAMTSGANLTGIYLIMNMPKKALKDPEEDGRTIIQ